MIYRGFVGKEFPPFNVEITESFCDQINALLQGSISPYREGLPSNWPGFLALRGSASLMTVWEELGVDPLQLRLIREEFLHYREPRPHEPLFGQVTVEDVSDHVESTHGIEEQVDLRVRFHDASGTPLAHYRCTYRVPTAPSLPPKD